MVKKSYVFFFIYYLILYLVCLLLGIAGIIIGIRGIYLTYTLNKTEETEKAIITRVSIRHRTPNITIYFTLQDQQQDYRKSVAKVFYGEAEKGQIIDIVFNDKRNFFVMKQYLTSTFITYSGYIVFGIIFIFLSFVLVPVVKEFFKLIKKDGEVTEKIITESSE